MFSRSTLSSSIHIVNRSLLICSCFNSSKNSLLFQTPKSLPSFGAAKLQTILNPATLFRIFFQKTSQPLFPPLITTFVVIGIAKVQPFFILASVYSKKKCAVINNSNELIQQQLLTHPTFFEIRAAYSVCRSEIPAGFRIYTSEDFEIFLPDKSYYGLFYQYRYCLRSF